MGWATASVGLKACRMRTKTNWSLKGRLSAFIFGLVLSLWALSAVVIYRQAEKESQELFDSSINETAKLLLFLSEHELSEVADTQIAGLDHQISQDHHYLSFQLWDNSGHLRYRSANAPLSPLAPLQLEGFSWQNHEGKVSRTFNLKSKDGLFRIVVADPLHHRQEISSHFLLSLGLFSVLLLPAAFLGARWLVGKAVQPIDDCARQVREFDIRRFSHVDDTGLPREITPLVDSLNSALSRIQAGIEREKRFTADAAHELRTPLTGIRANVQLLQRELQHSTVDQLDILDDTLQGVDRCSRMISQLLTLSRSESGMAQSQQAVSLDLGAILAEAMALEASYAHEKSISMTLEVESPERLSSLQERGLLLGHPTALIVLLRNLVNNAVHYTQTGGQVELACSIRPQPQDPDLLEVCLSVKDNGPGIPENKRSEVFERFHRLNPNQSKGSGLGLSICKEIASLHNTQVGITQGLENRGVGFELTLREQR